MSELPAKEFIDHALSVTGMTLDEMAAKLDYKSLRRIRQGEFPLPESKRRHIADLVRLAELERKLDASVVRDDGTILVLEAKRYAGSPREKLRSALKDAGLTPGALAKRMGYSAAVIAGVVNEGGAITESMVDQIRTVLPELSREDLLEGSETPRVMDREGFYGTVGSRPQPGLIPGETERYVPLLSMAAAGKVSDLSFTDGAYDQTTGVKSAVPDRKAFAVQIDGDSMTPEIKQGDFAIVSPSTRPELGKPVIVQTIDGDVLCKFYQTKDAGKTVVLSSVNQMYDTIEIPLSQIAWIYPVKEVKRRY